MQQHVEGRHHWLSLARPTASQAQPQLYQHHATLHATLHAIIIHSFLSIYNGGMA